MMRLNTGEMLIVAAIPTGIDQNPCTHSLIPTMDIIFHG